MIRFLVGDKMTANSMIWISGHCLHLLSRILVFFEFRKDPIVETTMIRQSLLKNQGFVLVDLFASKNHLESQPPYATEFVQFSRWKDQGCSSNRLACANPMKTEKGTATVTYAFPLSDAGDHLA